MEDLMKFEVIDTSELTAVSSASVDSTHGDWCGISCNGSDGSKCGLWCD